MTASPTKDEGVSRRVPIVTTKIPRGDSAKFVDNAADQVDQVDHPKKANARKNSEIYSDNDSQGSIKLHSDNDPTETPPSRPPVKLKVSALLSD